MSPDEEWRRMPLIFKAFLHSEVTVVTRLSFAIIFHEFNFNLKFYPMLLRGQTPSLRSAVYPHSDSRNQYGFFSLRRIIGYQLTTFEVRSPPESSGIVHICDGVVLAEVPRDQCVAAQIALHERAPERFNHNLYVTESHYSGQTQWLRIRDGSIPNTSGRPESHAMFFNDATGLWENSRPNVPLVNNLQRRDMQGIIEMVTDKASIPITRHIPWRQWDTHELFIPMGDFFWEMKTARWINPNIGPSDSPQYPSDSAYSDDEEWVAAAADIDADVGVMVLYNA